MKSRKITAAVAAGLAALALAAYADKVDHANGGRTVTSSKDNSESRLTKGLGINQGKVDGVDKVNKEITITHGHIRSKTVEMEPMTMPFPVQKASLLSKVKAGDKVKINVENIGGVATVTALKIQK